MSDSDNYLSVKEFAEQAGVSVQRIYQRLDTNLKPFIKTLNGKKRLSVEGLKLFEIKDLNKKQSSLEKNSAPPLEITPKGDSALITENTLLNEKIKALVKDLEKSEKIIAELQADKEKLNARLDKAEEERERLENNISNLTTALTAAQALHGMDKKQAVIEVKQQPTEDQISTVSEQQIQKELIEDSPQKLSFFQRLFRKDKNQR